MFIVGTIIQQVEAGRDPTKGRITIILQKLAACVLMYNTLHENSKGG